MSLLRNPKIPSASELAWPVGARVRIESLLLRVYRLTEGLEEQVPTGRSYAIVLAVGIGFSLWRAAFLSAPGRSTATMHSNARDFLGTLLRDNAINFPQDRETQAWSGGYYVNNAYFRLAVLFKALESNLPEVQIPSQYRESVTRWLEERERMTAPPDLSVSWDRAYEALESTIVALEAHA